MSSVLQDMSRKDTFAPLGIDVPAQACAVLFSRTGAPCQMPCRIAGRPQSIAVLPSLSIFVPPGADSFWNCDADAMDGWFHLHFSKIALDRTMEEHRVTMNQPFVRCDHRLDALVGYARDLVSRDEPPSALLWDSLCVLLLHRLSALATPDSDSEKRSERLSAWQVRRVVDFMSESLNTPITLGDLAELVELSPFHFARAFRNTVGIPPHRYQVMIRIERAKNLLITTSASILDVGCLVGYESHSSFARSFKREVGISPVSFRADHRGQPK